MDFDDTGGVEAVAQEGNFRFRVASTEVEDDGDSENEQQLVPEGVATFVKQLQQNIADRNSGEVYNLYESVFNKITERYYKSDRWPDLEKVQYLIPAGDLLTPLLYKEMYYRHIYSRLQITFDERQESWHNYSALLNHLIENEIGNPKGTLQLPAQWLWDMLDEFIYQFQTFTTYRNKMIKTNKEEEIAKIQAAKGMWSTVNVLNYLHKIVKKSGIKEYLEKTKAGEECTNCTEFSRFTGYFALIGLLRMQCLLGDYYLALKTIENLDFGTKALYNKVSACHTTLFYYLGFSYMMLRRFQDAVRTFSGILLHLTRTKNFYTLSYQQDQITKKMEQMSALLLITVALCPQRLDETLLQHIREKYYEKQQRLQRGEESTFEELFNYSCPKFISPSPIESENVEFFNPNEAHQRQMKLFLREVNQQQTFPQIRAYMRLYSAMPVSKLSTFLQRDHETLLTLLMSYKWKTRQLVRQGGAPLDGERTNCSDINYSLDGSMMHVAAQKQQKQYTGVFLQQITKFHDIIKAVERR